MISLSDDRVSEMRKENCRAGIVEYCAIFLSFYTSIYIYMYNVCIYIGTMYDTVNGRCRFNFVPAYGDLFRRISAMRRIS